MGRCRVDSTIERKTVGDFDFPLGVYPVEEMAPREGFTLQFESADGDDVGDSEGTWEEWTDRYVFDIVIRHARLEPLVRAMLAMFPGRIFPILDVLGNDAYREIDPYVAYELVGQERFTECLRRYRGWFFEDGLVGFGCMAEEPFLYLFVDEHKIITVRAETHMKERVEKVLQAFDLKEVEQIAGADAALHEHRGVLETPDERPDLLTADEIIEELQDQWGLELNVDGDKNVDESGTDLGVTPWRVMVRMVGSKAEVKYAEAVLSAPTLNEARSMAVEAVEELALPEHAEEMLDDDQQVDFDIITADRLENDDVAHALPKGTKPPTPKDLATQEVWSCRWLE